MGRGERTSACARAGATLIYGHGAREGAVGRPHQVKLRGRTPREEQDLWDEQTQHRGPAAEASPALEGTWNLEGAQLPTWGTWEMCSGTRRWGSNVPTTWISHLLHGTGHGPDPWALWWPRGSGFHLPVSAERRGAREEATHDTSLLPGQGFAFSSCPQPRYPSPQHLPTCLHRAHWWLIPAPRPRGLFAAAPAGTGVAGPGFGATARASPHRDRPQLTASPQEGAGSPRHGAVGKEREP